MAIFQPGVGVGGISGKVGGVVFANSRGSKVIRPRPARRTGAPPRTGFERFDTRAAMQRVTTAWRSLTAQERLGWASIAAQYPAVNRLGQARPVGAFQMFVRESMTRQAVSPTVQTAPPLQGVSANFTNVGAAFSVSGNYNVIYTAPNVGYSIFAILYARPLYQTKSGAFLGKLKAFGWITPAGSPQNVKTQYLAVFPPLQVGQAFVIGLKSMGSSRIVSSMVTAASVATA